MLGFGGCGLTLKERHREARNEISLGPGPEPRGAGARGRSRSWSARRPCVWSARGRQEHGRLCGDPFLSLCALSCSVEGLVPEAFKSQSLRITDK